jgi:hypothetical protein
MSLVHVYMMTVMDGCLWLLVLLVDVVFSVGECLLNVALSQLAHSWGCQTPPTLHTLPCPMRTLMVCLGGADWAEDQ